MQHIQVGRADELKSFVNDIINISEGGASFRFVIGDYGSGKTFFLSLVRSIGLAKGLVTMNADLSPIKRRHGTGEHSRSLLTGLVASLSTGTNQEGNALQTIIEKFISIAIQEASRVNKDVSRVIYDILKDLNEIPGGYAFNQIINKYWIAYEAGDDILKNRVLRWLKAEYTTKTDALRELGVRDIINGTSFYNTLRLYSIFIRQRYH